MRQIERRELGCLVIGVNLLTFAGCVLGLGASFVTALLACGLGEVGCAPSGPSSGTLLAAFVATTVLLAVGTIVGSSARTRPIAIGALTVGCAAAVAVTVWAAAAVLSQGFAA